MLWNLNSEETPENKIDFEIGSPEHKEWSKKMKERFKSKVDAKH